MAKKCLKGLRVVENKIVFDNKQVAFLFASTFLRKNLEHWAQFEAVARYRLFANVLRIALKNKIIKFSDFKKDDSFILNKLLKNRNKDIQKLLQILRNKSLEYLPRGTKIAHKKFRHVDPLFLQKGKLHKLSDADKRFKNLLEKVRKLHKQGVRLPETTALQ